MELAAKIILLLLALPAFVMFVAAVTVWRGYVLSKVWAWLAVPIFHVPALTIAQAIGVALVVSFLTFQHDWNAARAEETKWKTALAMIFLGPAMTLAMAWVVKQYI